MTLFDLVGTGVSAILSGGATGLLGVLLQRGFDFLKGKQDLALLKLKNDHELAMRDKDAALMREEWAGRLRVAETEGAAKSDVAQSEAFATSLLREPERYTNASTLTPAQQWFMVALDFARGLVRPGLTVYLCALTTVIWYQVRQLLSVEDLATSDVLDVWRTVVSTILYLTTTVVLWWFGTRNKQVQPAALSLRAAAPRAPAKPAG